MKMVKYLLLICCIVLLVACSKDDVAPPDNLPTATPSNSAEIPNETSVSVTNPDPSNEEVVPATNEPTTIPKSTLGLAPFKATACADNLVAMQRPISCGTISVQADRNDSATDSITIPVVIFTRNQPALIANPIFYVSGGMGVSQIDRLPTYVDTHIAPLLTMGDVIMFDQRGTGASEPSLRCEPFQDAYLESWELNGPQRTSQLSALTNCVADWMSSVDLTDYTTEAMALDGLELIEGLGFSKINLYGAGHGARIAQEMVRLAPERIDRLVLSSPMPVDGQETLQNQFKWMGDSLDLLFADCAADERCSEQFEPDMATAWADSQINKVIGLGMLNGLSSAETIPLLPRMFTEWQASDTYFTDQLFAPTITDIDAVAMGTRLAVLCQEYGVDTAVVPDNLGAIKFIFKEDLFIGHGWQTMCKALELPMIEPVIAKWDIPTMIFTGEFDPIVASTTSAEIANNLTDVVVYDIMGQSHHPQSDCITAVQTAFFTGADVDDGCLTLARRAAYPFETTFLFDTVLRPYEKDRLQLLTPVGWEERAIDFFVYRPNLLEEIVYTHGIVYGKSGDQQLELLRDSLGLAWQSKGDVVTELYQWRVYKSDKTDGRHVQVAIANDKFRTVWMMVISDETDANALYDRLLLPAIQQLAPYEPVEEQKDKDKDNVQIGL